MRRIRGCSSIRRLNLWHTSKNTARINASNPCSEYMFLDDSACNLASLNLMKFTGSDGQFDVEAYRHGVGIMVMIVQEIINHNAAYPTDKIAKNSARFPATRIGICELEGTVDVDGYRLVLSKIMAAIGRRR